MCPLSPPSPASDRLPECDFLPTPNSQEPTIGRPGKRRDVRVTARELAKELKWFCSEDEHLLLASPAGGRPDGKEHPIRREGDAAERGQSRGGACRLFPGRGIPQ